jgi:putative SOS response-associated peptidase YedK
MCGRYTLTRPAPDVAAHLRVAVPEQTPRWNIAPTQPVLCVRQTGTGQAEAVLLRWGLVPSWAADLSIGNRLLNARAETVREKPAFRTAFQRRRCLIAADGFYEWQTVGKRKQPVHFRLGDGGPFAFAGLWERWSPPGAPPVETCTILTTAANELVRPVHERMPVILDPERYPAWLDPRVNDIALLHAWLGPYPAAAMTAAAANPAVNDARHEGAALWAGPLVAQPSAAGSPSQDA